MTAPTETWTLGVAFLLGIGGGVHCAAMCGGIASALGQSGAPDGPRGGAARRSLVYNAGRITSYALIGALVGSLGLGVAALGGEGGGTLLRVALGVVIATTGLVLMGSRRAAAPIEALGARVWRRISPLTARLGPQHGGLRLFAVGALWGWLPCGLVYAAATASLATATPLEGAAFMASFGVGTLPAMWFAGAFAGRVGAWLRNAELRRALGLLVVSYGLWTAAAAMGWLPAGHDGGAHEHGSQPAHHCAE